MQIRKVVRNASATAYSQISGFLFTLYEKRVSQVRNAFVYFREER